MWLFYRQFSEAGVRVTGVSEMLELFSLLSLVIAPSSEELSGLVGEHPTRTIPVIAPIKLKTIGLKDLKRLIEITFLAFKSLGD